MDDFKDKIKEIKRQVPDPKIYVQDVEQEPYECYSPKKKKHKINVPAKVEKYEPKTTNEEDLEVDSPAHELVEQVRSGELAQEDLTPDTKFIIIRYLREVEKLKQDDIAAELKISRRTVINYCNKIKQLNAQKLNDTTSMELGGELYQMSKEAMKESLKKGNVKGFAYVMQTMITVLQSMGLVFKAPSQLQQKNLNVSGSLQDLEGFKKMQQGMTDHDTINIEEVEKDLFSAVLEGEIVKDE